MKFVLLAPVNIMVGIFELNEDNRQWTFKYSDEFKKSDFLPLEGFPLVDNTYGHDACVTWLSSRITIKDLGKGFTLASAINNRFNKSCSPLELHLIN